MNKCSEYFVSKWSKKFDQNRINFFAQIRILRKMNSNFRQTRMKIWHWHSMWNIGQNLIVKQYKTLSK
jgi:hypothetical protein